LDNNDMTNLTLLKRHRLQNIPLPNAKKPALS
jgi:hypothetical protein